MSQRIPSQPQAQSDLLAAFCKAGGDPLRLHILRVLTHASFGVMELAHIFATGQSGISHHLKVLSLVDLVTTRREGNAIFYRRSLASGTPEREALHGTLLEAIDRLPLPRDIQQRMNEVHHQRSAASQEFFQRKAGSFQDQQDLIAGLPQYQDGLFSLLDRIPQTDDKSVLEIGPGHGQLLPELARRFRKVFALDNSPAMLEQARVLCRDRQLHNIELQQADVMQDSAPPVDCIILNMVLHHLSAPGEALQQLARTLNPGGSLLLTELCNHDQDWTREACGDLWLGFEPQDLLGWARAAGLQPGENLYIGLKNGFQIQAHQFMHPDTHSPSPVTTGTAP